MREKPLGRYARFPARTLFRTPFIFPHIHISEYIDMFPRKSEKEKPRRLKRGCVSLLLVLLASLVHCTASSVPSLFPLGVFLLNHTDPANSAYLRQNIPVY